MDIIATDGVRGFYRGIGATPRTLALAPRLAACSTLAETQSYTVSALSSPGLLVLRTVHTGANFAKGIPSVAIGYVAYEQARSKFSKMQ